MELPPHDLTGALASPFYGGPWAFVTARAGRTPVASAAVPQEAPAPGTPFYGRRPGWVPRFPQKSKKDANFPLAFSREPCYTKQSFRRYSSSVERKLPKLDRRVRLPLPAPKARASDRRCSRFFMVRFSVFVSYLLSDQDFGMRFFLRVIIPEWLFALWSCFSYSQAQRPAQR